MWLTKNKTLRQALGLLETLNLLYIRLAIKNPSRSRLFPGKVFREYMSLVEKDKWACKNISDILAIPSGARIVLEHMSGEGINNAIDELAYLALFAKVCEPQNIFEIGTFRGRTALNFALNSPDNCTVLTLDLPPDDRESFLDKTNTADASIISASFTGVDYKGKDCEHKIIQLYGNSIEFDFSPYFGRMDIVFVDGAHHYEAVCADIANAVKMVKQGGWIIWHDFANYGDYNDVTRAILDTLPREKIVQVANTELAAYQH
jgi:predicted O-methyltransferase YrrM